MSPNKSQITPLLKIVQAKPKESLSPRSNLVYEDIFPCHLQDSDSGLLTPKGHTQKRRNMCSFVYLGGRFADLNFLLNLSLVTRFNSNKSSNPFPSFLRHPDIRHLRIETFWKIRLNNRITLRRWRHLFISYWVVSKPNNQPNDSLPGILPC